MRCFRIMWTCWYWDVLCLGWRITRLCGEAAYDIYQEIVSRISLRLSLCRIFSDSEAKETDLNYSQQIDARGRDLDIHWIWKPSKNEGFRLPRSKPVWRSVVFELNLKKHSLEDLIIFYGRPKEKFPTTWNVNLVAYSVGNGFCNRYSNTPSLVPKLQYLTSWIIHTRKSQNRRC